MTPGSSSRTREIPARRSAGKSERLWKKNSIPGPWPGAKPGDSSGAITVGNVGVDGAIARFSSDGPTFDGRLKPEILSQGERVGTVSLTDPKGFSYASGSSLATPVLAGAGACLLQVHPEWTARDFRKALFESGDFFRREGKPDPLFVHGYGVPDVYRAAGLDKK